MTNIPTLSADDLSEIFARFLNEAGEFTAFKEWAEAQGYSMHEFGFEED